MLFQLTSIIKIITLVADGICKIKKIFRDPPKEKPCEDKKWEEEDLNDSFPEQPDEHIERTSNPHQ